MDGRKYSSSTVSRGAGLDSESEPIAAGARLPGGSRVDTHCFHGDELSQGLAAALRIMGLDRHGLPGGMEPGNEQGSPSRRNTDDIDPQ
jgi:hypothetical protein